jgi:hypothetical protein
MKLIVEITRQDYADFNKFDFRQTKLKKSVVSALVTLLVLQFGLNFNKLDWFATIITSVCFVVVYAFLINNNLNKTKNIPSDNGAILGDKEYEFDEDKIRYKEFGSEGSIEWKTVMHVKESATSFYLYMDTNMAMLVPKRYFKDADEIVEFKELTSQKIIVA